MLITGTIMTPDTVYVGGSLQIDKNGFIAGVGCIDTTMPKYTHIHCPDGIVSPGLINAHDHLTYDQNKPGNWGNVRYDRRNEWRKGLAGKPKIIAPKYDTTKPLQVAWSELRHIMAGTTTAAGSGGYPGLLRNVDREDLQEGLTGGIVDYDTFPLGDWSDVAGHTNDCDYPQVVDKSVLKNLVFLPHVAEGINAFARNEALCLTGRGTNPQSPGVDLAAANASFIHSVAGNPADGEVYRKAGMSLVWSPRSNISLYGNTAPITQYRRQKINLALATDWTPSGSMNLLREFQCAKKFNKSYLNKFFSARDLWLMTTHNAAKALGFGDQIGGLTVGMRADIAIFKSNDAGYYQSIIDAQMQDVVLVMRAGVALYGDDDIVKKLTQNSPGCERLPFDVCGTPKRLCTKYETGYSFADFQAQNQESYALFFCGTPANEPTCKPMRSGEYSGDLTATDKDGDGIANGDDNCPDTFNPIRPMDNGKQADFNGNGIGDACDPNPY